MTIRLDCNIDDTAALLKSIMQNILVDKRVMFLCEPGMGVRRIQAARVMLSRTRAKLKRKGKKIRYFGMHHHIMPWTENAKRYDCVVVWGSKSQRHQIMETLEDMIGNGDSL
jgi:hypothetical protein